MYAVIEISGKQYKVAKNDTILVERQDAKAGTSMKVHDVLLVKDGETVHVGAPHVKGAHVTCEVVSEIRADKVIAYKYKRRKSEKKKVGHRQALTRLHVKEIEIGKG